MRFNIVKAINQPIIKDYRCISNYDFKNNTIWEAHLSLVCRTNDQIVFVWQRDVL